MARSSQIVYRPTRTHDLVPAAKMILQSINALRNHTGKTVIKRPVRQAPPLAVHLYKTNPGLSFCAWRGNHVVGFVLAVLRGKQWYLADLFVHPKFQDQKVGKQLMERVWRSAPGMTHALATFGYNMQAVGLYSSYGLAVLEPMALMAAKSDQLNRPESTGLTVASRNSRDDIDWIHALESRIRGYAHPTEWEYWLHKPNFKLSVYRDGSRRVGYCLCSNDGILGPAGGISNENLRRVVTETLASTNLEDKQLLRTFCPTTNVSLYRLLLDCGFRLRELTVFMSDTRYGDFQKYLPADLSVF